MQTKSIVTLKTTSNIRAETSQEAALLALQPHDGLSKQALNNSLEMTSLSSSVEIPLYALDTHDEEPVWCVLVKEVQG